MQTARFSGALLVLLLAGCGGEPPDEAVHDSAYASTYAAAEAATVAIVNATALTGTGKRIDAATIVMVDGRIEIVAADLAPPRGATVVDAAGKWVTPGIIDVHSHLGVYPSPSVAAHSDGNEMVDPNTAQVWAEHAVWPQDPGFALALAGGVTSMQVLPGSANLFGGRSVTLKNVSSRTMQGMKFPGAPYGLKMACGENPKRVYGTGKGSAPMTRMGNVAGYREAWIKAAAYKKKWQGFAKDGGEEPERDLQLETLAGVLDGEILVHNHCYRADEMAIMLDVAREFGYRVTAFHHAVEAYKIADLLAESGTCAAVWADWWGFKVEAFDAVRENAAMVDAAGACAIVHSDSATGIQRLNQEAAKIMAAAQRSGWDVTPERAIVWITANAANALGIGDQTGTLESGKMADVVIWDGNPFSVYARAERVYIDGVLAFDRNDADMTPQSDFMLGLDIAGGSGQ